MRASPRPLTVGGTAVLVAVSTGIAAALWWPVYEHPQFILLVAVADVLGVALAVAAVQLRWPGWALLVASVALFLLIGVPLAVPAQAVAGVLPSADGLLDLVAGVALGWKQLLTITLPVGDYQALLVPLLVLVLVSAIAGVRIGVLERAGGWALAGPVLLGVSGVLFGDAPPPAAVPLALALLAVSLSWLAARRMASRRAALRALGATGRGAGAGRSIAAGAAILAVAAAVALAATNALPPTSERQVLREQVEQPFDPRDEPSPLSGFRAYLREESADEPQLRVSGLEPGDRIRLAALDRYDGVVYGFGGGAGSGESGFFVRVPTAVEYPPGSGSPRTIDVEVLGYEGVWLPAAGLVEQLRFSGAAGDGFVLDLASGTAVVVDGLGRGDAYRITSLVPPQPELADLAEATPGDAVLPRVEVVPDGLTELLDSWTGGIPEPGPRLVEAIGMLRETGYISHGLSADEPPSRSGHGADRISELVSGTRMIGDAEQYAVAAALMARQLGFPARVVIGFVPPQSERDGAVQLRGADVSAWIEVDTAEHGWVTIDPVPPVRPIPEEEPQELTRISRPQSVVPPPPEQLAERDDQATPESEGQEPDRPDPVLAAFLAMARVVGTVLVVLAVLSAPFLLVVAAKLQRRRRRRRAEDPLERVRGGWEEFADAAVDHGIPAGPGATRSEFAARAGGLPARILASAVDRATFAPERVDAEQAERVWEAVEELRAGFDAGLSPWRRLRALLSLQSFRGYRGLRLFGGRRERA